MGRASELRVGLIGGDQLATALSPLCRLELLRPGEDLDKPLDRLPNFLLVEAAAGIDTVWGGALDQLVERCRTLAVPRLLWITTSPLNRFWRDRCARFDRVFSMDWEQVLELETTGAKMPSTLWPATSLPVDAQPFVDEDERPDAILWLGGWHRDWPAVWRQRLSSVLRAAAPRGLRIVATADLTDLPPDFRPYVVSPADDERCSLLRRAKVVVAADAAVGRRRFGPAIAFDSVALGAAAITPHNFTLNFSLALAEPANVRPRDVIPYVHDFETAAKEFDRLLSDELLRRDVVTHGRRIVANNHTYAHRLATLASAAGYRLIPDAHHPAPA